MSSNLVYSRLVGSALYLPGVLMTNITGAKVDTPGLGDLKLTGQGQVGDGVDRPSLVPGGLLAHPK